MTVQNLEDAEALVTAYQTRDQLTHAVTVLLGNGPTVPIAFSINGEPFNPVVPAQALVNFYNQQITAANQQISDLGGTP